MQFAIKFKWISVIYHNFCIFVVIKQLDMNLLSFSEHFGTEDDCINHFKSERDKIGLTCKCGSTEHFWIKSRLS